MNVSKNTNAIKILIFLLIAGAIACIIIAITNSDSETKTTPSPPDIEAKWVAVGNGDADGYGNIMYSEDGKTWKKTSSGHSFGVLGGYGVAYGTSNGASPLWVAVGEGGGYGSIMYSENGKIWTETSSGDSFSSLGLGRGVAYGTSNGASPLWVAVGSDGLDGGYGSIMYSENGKIWTETSSGDSFSSLGLGLGVAYGTSNGVSPLWVAVGDDGLAGGYGSIMYSSDGKEWTKTSSGDSFTGYGSGVAYGTSNGVSPLWVAVGDDGTSYGSIMYSSDGKIWTKTSSGDSFKSSDFAGGGVAYGTSNGVSPLWVAVGDDGLAGGYGSIMYSSDGKEWTKTSSGDSFTGYGSGGIRDLKRGLTIMGGSWRRRYQLWKYYVQ